jgi:chitinase
MKRLKLENETYKSKLIGILLVGIIVVLTFTDFIHIQALNGVQLSGVDKLNQSIIGYITWGNLDNIWNGGATLATEPSLNYLTHMIGPAVVPTSTSNPVLKGMYGNLSIFNTIVNAGHSKGIKVFPYLYGEMPMLDAIIKAGTLSVLVNSTVSLVTTYNLDGIVLDIESPNKVNQANMRTLIDTLYPLLNPLGKSIRVAGMTGKPSPDIGLTTAQEVDAIEVMCYDMSGHPDQTNGNFPHSSFTDTITAMKKWIKMGFPKNKLIMGIPIYGKDEALTEYPYSEIIEILNPTPDQDYGYIGAQYVWWNGINTTKAKVDWALQNGLGGVMIFAVGYDKLNDGRSLLKTIYDEFNITH